MPSRAVLLALGTCLAAPLGAQVYTPPQPPCDIKPGHFQVTSAVVNLQSAATKPNTRERMLRQTQDVLSRAITAGGQDKNPAAWYYFGRYYVEMGDAAGADSAFRHAEALAPQCKQDIDGYRQELWGDVVASGLRNWQERRPDSAKMLLRAAARLRPNHPKPFLSLGQLYASENQLDSAGVWFAQAATASGDDTAFVDSKKEALGSAARLTLGRLQRDTAAQRWQRTRFSRDSIQRLLAADSTILARIEASSVSRRTRGARLAPADQQSFARDSTARVRAVADRRAALTARAQATAADSAAAQPAFDPAIRAFRSYLEAYPDATEAVTALANLYYQSGRLSESEAAFEAIYPSSRQLMPALAVDAGRGALRANAYVVGTKLLARGLDMAPYDRDGLVDLANGYLALRDSVHLLPVAQRLAAIDPLNRTTLRLVAAGWDLRGRRDSAQKYRDRAEGGLQVEVAIANFQRDSSGYTLSGVATNAANTPAPVQRLTFEFLDGAGNVQVSETIEIPPIPPQGSQPIEVRVPGTALVAWRYRPT
jgi:tetratricopeptide (TPR) repeat protein